MAMGWEKSAGATGIVAAIIFFVAVIVAISGGMTFGTDSFETFFTDSTFQVLTAVAGTVTAVCGVLYGGKGTKSSSMVQCVLGVALIIAGAVTIVLAYYGTIGLKWQAAFNSFAVIFVLTAIIAAISDGLEGARVATAIDVILIVILAVAFVENSFLEGMMFPIAAMLLVLFIGIMCFLSRSGAAAYDADSRSADKKDKDKDKPVAKRKDKKAEPKFYETTPAAKPAAGTDAAAKEEAPKAVPAKPAEPAKPAAQPVKETPKEAPKETPVAPAAQPVEPAKAPEKQPESTPALPKMVSSHDADRAAAAARANRAKAAEEAAEPQPAAEEPAPVVEAPAEEPTPVVETPVEEPAPVKEESVPAAETQAAEPAAEEPAPAEEEESAPVVEAPAEEPTPVVEVPAEPAKIAPAEEPAAIEPAEVPLAVEAPAAQEAIEPAAQPVAVAAPVEPAKIAPAEEPAAIEEPQSAEEPADSEEEAASLEELGLVPDTPETFVRRACWNLGLRCRKDYGDRKIPVAFVKGDVAVYIDGDVPDHSNDEALKEEGWTVLHFALADITDGQEQAKVVAAAVKENVRSKKAAKRKGKR